MKGDSMEKEIVVILDMNKAGLGKDECYREEALRELNEHLNQGWSVKHSYGMGGTSNILFAASLVILEKKS